MPSVLTVYGNYLNLDKDHNGMLSKQKLADYGSGTLTSVFLDRVFGECRTFDGEMDYKTFLVFLSALDNRATTTKKIVLHRMQIPVIFSKNLRACCRDSERRPRVSSCELPDDPEDIDSPEAIKAGSLTIENDESKSVQNAILPLNCGTVLRFIIYMLCRTMGFEILTARLMPPNGEDLKVKRYVVYDLTVRLDSKFAADSRPAVIKRRYTDFLI
uniref:EF-hand domain-containing protein n=1 Tax=Glossina pallidipes TaxID=7398 RepID=A0A1B0AIQ3_GLOPL